ncbi:MAG: hypothetical protein K2L46_08850 [Paramuribaculum sp.]|nr:hypothetical protein [Paramuribaculum sp.]MDE6322668.1 hypothetical protein [Paramuribaculum sp.]MDE6489375.1 hypothetical protein [Paramuribaculum sp.]
MKEFDESAVLKEMRKSLPENISYSDDDLLNIVDMIWDYYEMNGLLDVDIDSENDTDDEEIDIVSELIDYARRMLKKDKACKVNPDHLEALIRAELAYEDALDAEMLSD